MSLPDVAQGDPHVVAHNNERHLLNDIQDLSDEVFANALSTMIVDSRPTLYLTDFGPIGTADDKVTWNAAISAMEALPSGAVLTLPQNAASTVRNLRIQQSNCTIDLNGSTVTHGGTNPNLTPVTGVADETVSGIFAVYPSSDSTWVENVEIRNGTLVGDRSDWVTLKSDVVPMMRAKFWRLTNITVRNAGQDCFQFYLCYDGVATDCTGVDAFDSVFDFRYGDRNTLIRPRGYRVKNLVQSKPGAHGVTIRQGYGESYGPGVEWYGDRWDIEVELHAVSNGLNSGDTGYLHGSSSNAVRCFKNPGYADQTPTKPVGTRLRVKVDGYSGGIVGESQGGGSDMATQSSSGVIAQNYVDARDCEISNCVTGVYWRGPGNFDGTKLSNISTTGLRVHTAGIPSSAWNLSCDTVAAPVLFLYGAGERSRAGGTFTACTGTWVNVPRSFESNTHNGDNFEVDVRGTGTSKMVSCVGQTGCSIRLRGATSAASAVTAGIRGKVHDSYVDMSSGSGTRYAYILDEDYAELSNCTSVGGTNGVRVTANDCKVDAHTSYSAGSYGVQVVSGANRTILGSSNRSYTHGTSAVQDSGTGTIQRPINTPLASSGFYADTATSSAVANTAVETTLGDVTVPGGTVVAPGTSLRVSAGGKVTSIATSGQLTLKLVAVQGGTTATLGQLQIATQGTAGSAKGWSVMAAMTFRDNGAGAFVIASMSQWNANMGAGTQSGASVLTPGGTFTAGADITLKITATWATADAGNTITRDVCILELAKP